MSEDQKDPKTDQTALDDSNQDKYELSLQAMIRAGVHFGHKKSRWNPRMAPYIFGFRNNVHIIDLEKSLELFEKALAELENVVQGGGTILLVGTKKQAKELVEAVAQKAELPFVSERWLGGTFTNFENIKKRLKYLADQKDLLEKGKLSRLTKFERNKLQKKLDKIELKMGGLSPMRQLPDLVFILDINKDHLALKEAKRVGIKTMGLIDTNSDPQAVDFPIPANDDALSSLKYILGVVLKRILNSKTS